jgi:hypothetical protein
MDTFDVALTWSSTCVNSVYQKRDRKVDILYWIQSHHEPEVHEEVL